MLSPVMLTGTPLLVRIVNEKSQESLQICTCLIESNNQVLTCIEQDGQRRSHKVQINTIAEVSEERPIDPQDQGSIRLTFSGQQGSPKSLELICASQEDHAAWLNGLRSLAGGAAKRASPQASPARSPAAAARAAANSQRSRGMGVSTGVGATSVHPEAAGVSMEMVSQLLQKVELQEHLITELRQENGVLNVMVKQKDAVISQLTHDMQSRGTKGDHCNKTASTSRESDDHLRDRETAILKRKNVRLKQQLQKKQKTITNLMQTLQSALGGQTSDGDLLRTEDEGDEVDSDTVADAGATRGGQLQASEGSGSEPEAIREEVRALTGKLARLERDVEELGIPDGFAGSPSQWTPAQAQAMLAASKAAAAASTGPGPFQPPPRGVAQHSPSTAAQKKAAAVAAAKAGSPSRGMADFDFTDVGGVPSLGEGVMSKSSKAALEALARETKVLEEKKRRVEELARQLEPPSDEEDDGFPLQ